MAICSGITRYLKEGLLALSILLALPAIRAHFVDIDGLSAQVGYIGRLAVLWIALLAAAFIRPAPLRWLTALMLSISAFVLTTFERATTQFLTYDAFITMMNSHGAETDALVQNQMAFIGAAGPTLVLLFAVGLAPRRRTERLPSWLLAVAPWLATAGLAGILFVRGGDGAAGQPPSFTGMAYLALASYEAATGEIGERQPVQLPHERRPRSRNIVLIVDESIAGQYLDINSANGVPTPLSRPWSGIDIHNYGLAISVTNCSVSSNVTLRYGGTRSDYRRIIATQPSIWAYARKAGLRTVYLDGQMNGGTLANFMTEAERAEIDRFAQFDKVNVDARDMAIADELKRELADPRPKFILVNKNGAHFPIQDKFPAGYLHYRPALSRSGEFDKVLAGQQPGFKGTPAEWVRYRNSYRNTLLWTVGAFFDTVLRNADLSNTTIIYTSDHGQNLHEDGSPGLYTHCGPDPLPAEGVVPLVVVEGNRASGLDWQRDIARNRDRSSHFMIFPTLLTLMGYDRAASASRYGKPLTEASVDPGTFNTLFNARLNREPTWLPVDRRRISAPPESDGATAAWLPAKAES